MVDAMAGGEALAAGFVFWGGRIPAVFRVRVLKFVPFRSRPMLFSANVQTFKPFNA